MRVMIFGCFLFIFCFKQKTAYEMRISDWSSDVCSSDLVLDPADAAIDPALAHARARWPGRAAPPGVLRIVLEHRPVGSGGRDADREVGRAEIGRASCRERVCQYV